MMPYITAHQPLHNRCFPDKDHPQVVHLSDSASEFPAMGTSASKIVGERAVHDLKKPPVTLRRVDHSISSLLYDEYRAATELLIDHLVTEDLGDSPALCYADHMRLGSTSVQPSARRIPTTAKEHRKATLHVKSGSKHGLARGAGDANNSLDQALAVYSSFQQQADNTGNSAPHREIKQRRKRPVDALKRLEQIDGLLDYSSYDERKRPLECTSDSIILTRNAKGKGREPISTTSRDTDTRHQARPSGSKIVPKLKHESSSRSDPTCGICSEPFKLTANPLRASQTPTSSSRLPFGLQIPCPGEHSYCLDCITGFIRSKLYDGFAGGNFSSVIFPIRCPECPVRAYSLSDDVAQKVLPKDLLEAWHHQRLLDSMPKRYCPNPECSILLEIDDDTENPQAECPSCHKLVCMTCLCIWHTDLTCEEYEQLPADERSPEDRMVLELAKAEHWRRCPSCHVIVELSQGCYHITCICKFEFCHRCGSEWKDKCTREPACELWDEQMLLEAQERERMRAVEEPAPLPIPPRWAPVPPGRAGPYRPVHLGGPPRPIEAPPYRKPPPAHLPYPHADDEFDWVDDTNILAMNHPFTSSMIRYLTCGYCGATLNSVLDLRYHLQNTTRHNVYACCGRFFQRWAHYEQHNHNDFYHVYTFLRVGDDTLFRISSM